MSVRVNLLMSWGRQAWSETHYLVAETSINNAAGGAQILAAKRAACLGFDAFVFAARLSDPANPGLSLLLRFNPPMQGKKVNINIAFITSVTSDNAGLANDAILVDAGGVVGLRFHRSRPMMGAPPAGLIQSVAGVPSVLMAECPDWTKAFNDFSANLTDGGWGFRVTNEGVPFPVQAITGGGGAGPIALVVDNAFTPAAQTLVHVRGMRVHPNTRVPLAGKWRTLAPVIGPLPGTNSIGLANSANMPPGTDYLLPGTVQTAAATLAVYTKFDVATGATRKRGGNLELPRGRSRIRF